MRLIAFVVFSAAWRLATSTGSGNMNGKYRVASGARQDVGFNDDYASKGHEYFDVWAPEIATHYGEVFWTDQGNQPLPTEIVKRFKGKVIAITGYEMDQVMVEPVGQPGLHPDKDVSVPINWAYNHHYMAFMTGAHSEIRRVAAAPGDPMAHGASSKLIAVDRPSAAYREDPSIPTSQFFSEGNGGESRKSFHGYPEGYAQLIESPDTWHITPMQIDTRNRDCGVTPASITNCTKFTPGPEPKQARYGLGVPKDTNYSGILECPCNSRYGGDPMFYPEARAQTKILSHKYTIVGTGACAAGELVENASDCFAAATTLGLNASHFINKSVADPALPPGCSVTVEGNQSAVVYFNTAGRGNCSASSKRSGEGSSKVGVNIAIEVDATNTFQRSPAGEFCENNRKGKIQAFPMRGSTLAAAEAARDQCTQFCWDDASCWGCSVDCEQEPYAYGALISACQWNAITSCGKVMKWSGSIRGDISQKQPQNGSVRITLSGPAGAWFGAGFNASAMADSPYTLVANDAGVTERKIGTCGSEAEHCPGDLLSPSLKVLSNSVVKGVRTVVVSRGLAGLTKNHYSFNPHGDETIHFITAVGESQTFAYHRAHGPAQVALTSEGSNSCICDKGITGRLCETGGVNCAEFEKDCVAFPAGDLKAQRNPTCNSRQYAGGLSCCHHKRIMLDADQEIRPELLRYHMKFRFWFQEYKPAQTGAKASHADLPRIYYQTEAHAGEYDIPPAFAKPGHPVVGYPDWPVGTPTPGTNCTGTCPDGPDCECVHTITYHWTVSNIRLIYAGGHCHAPSCISIELYHNLTGTPELLCRQLPYYGQGNFPKDKWDEAGYVTLPPCLWSDEDPKLDRSVWLPANTPLFSIKKNNNTHLGHFGEMASWQMRGVNFPADPPTFV